jgi:hypothetical protein
MTRWDQAAQLRAGLEAKYFGHLPAPPQELLDKIWSEADLSSSDWATTHKEWLQATKSHYGWLAKLALWQPGQAWQRDDEGA